jgi:hypothetical protein
MKESRKEFIKEAHSNACRVWKENIEKEFPELFKKDDLVRGWYRVKGNQFALAFIQGFKETYGFDYKGRWTRTWYENRSFTKYTPATDKEVEEVLIKEAKNRGLKPLNHRCLQDGKIWSDNIGDEYEYTSKFNKLEIGASVAFEDGKWAEIIKETITKEQAEKELGKTIIN